MTAYGLSKSRLMDGLQCPKLLWVRVHEPERIVFGADTQRIFAMGHQVGAVAQSLHAGGVLIGGAERGRLTSADLRAALDETRDLLAGSSDDLALFEATFEHDGVLVRTDLFFREHGDCRFTEVKASTAVKDHHARDAAIQTWVLRECGVPIARVSLSHIDNTFVYAGDGDYAGLFVDEDISVAVDELTPLVPGWVGRAREILGGEMPPVPVGRQCRDPYVCPLLDWCRACDGDVHVGYLPGGARLVEQLQEEGFTRLRDVPAGRLTGDLQVRVWQATVGGRPRVDPAISAELRAIGYPRYYFDFETINFAVPVWAGTRPWQQLPTQFSCHVEDADGRLEHVVFLDVSGEPPMRACAEALLEALGEGGGGGSVGGGGPVLVYHAPFEATILRQLAERFPDLAGRLQAVVDRIVDLLPIVKRNYYHPDMRGSWSLKAVLPTVAPDLDYGDLDEVQDGVLAQVAYEEAIAPGTSADRRETIRRNLLRYCERDTLAMVRMVEYFQ